MSGFDNKRDSHISCYYANAFGIRPAPYSIAPEVWAERVDIPTKAQHLTSDTNESEF